MGNCACVEKDKEGKGVKPQFDEFHSENFQSNYSNPNLARDGYNSPRPHDENSDGSELGSIGSAKVNRSQRKFFSPEPTSKAFSPDQLDQKEKIVVKGPTSEFKPRLSATKPNRGRQAA